MSHLATERLVLFVCFNGMKFMHDFDNGINYDLLINNHLKGVVADALRIAENFGLPGENHFYITFKTNYPGVTIPEMLKIQYPESMTIVLQHQYSDLSVDDEKFSVVLTFGGIPQTLIIPFDSISYFADPYAKFGLSFNFDENQTASKLEDLEIESEDEPSLNKQEVSAPAEVISIDSFRNK